MTFKLPETLSSIPSYSLSGTSANSQRPRTLQTSKSFSRLEPSKNALGRSRASTVQNILQTPSANVPDSNNEDLFDRDIAEESLDDEQDVQSQKMSTLPDDFDELPIELVNLTDR
jgi:hypothetical protein